MKEGVFSLGEINGNDKDSIKVAVLDQRVNQLESWKNSFEQIQQARFERMEEETNKRIERIEGKIDKFVTELGNQIGALANQINEQKNNWFKNIPWPYMLLVTTLTSCVVYLLTKH